MVTGGSSGIGRSIATALAAAGADIALIARQQPALDDTATSIRATGGNAVTIAADLGERDALARACDAVVDALGEPDIIVNAAAVNIRPPLGELTVEEWDRTIAVNLDAPFLLGQRFAPAMASRGWGRIINIVSQQAVRAYADSGAYGASKGGLAALTRSQAEAWSACGVTANAIAPGVVDTPLNARLFADPQRVAGFADRTLTKRNGRPDDFAGAAVFLASDAAGQITGQTLFVDGGFSVH